MNYILFFHATTINIYLISRSFQDNIYEWWLFNIAIIRPISELYRAKYYFVRLAWLHFSKIPSISWFVDTNVTTCLSLQLRRYLFQTLTTSARLFTPSSVFGWYHRSLSHVWAGVPVYCVQCSSPRKVSRNIFKVTYFNRRSKVFNVTDCNRFDRFQLKNTSILQTVYIWTLLQRYLL